MSTKLTDTLDSTTIVKKYLKAIKATDWKTADRLAKLFPYLLTKPKWEKENPTDFDQLVIKLHCQYLDTCKYCQQEEHKRKEIEDKKHAEARERNEVNKE